MKKETVYFLPFADGENTTSLARKATKAAEVAGLDRVVVEGRPCAIKQHFGESKNTGYVKPEVTRAIVAFVKKAGGEAFVTDTNTLYRGRRSRAVDHLTLAWEHGFSFDSLSAPVIVSDGLYGVDQVTVPIRGGKHFKEVRLASAGYQAPSAIVLTHVKGHCQMGLGGSIKNVGMGFAARAGKLAQHSKGRPDFDRSRCKACRTCARWCPADAIVMENKARLVAERCIGCGECLALCPHGAIGFSWDVKGPVLIERVCEHVLGFLSNKAGRVGYLNFLVDVTKNCDCLGIRQKAEYPNVGVFASTDIVAVDKAVADVSRERYGKDIWAAWWPDSQYEKQFCYGEKIGIGTANYELIEVE